VIRKTPVPVLLLRPFWSYELQPAGAPEQRPVRNLLLPVDGSDLSLEALPGVIEFADLFETRIVLLRVLEEKKRKSASADGKAEAEKQLQALARSIEKKGVETLSLVEKGDPTEQILKAIRFNDIDLIAMTTHGRSGLRRAVTGSVTENVLRNATVPLLITRNEGAATKGKARRAAKARS
jgi:nucleotide-binding universal stress UspA family protein